MNRISIFKNNWFYVPTIEDFKVQKTQILLNRMLTMYALKQDGKIVMVHPYQINDILLEKKVDANLQDVLCEFINKIPKDCWQNVTHKLNLNKTVKNL